MKKYIFTFLLLFLACSVIAQKRVVPTQEQIARVERTTTNIVLTGENMLLEAALRSAVEKNWTITPVTFIDNEEFLENIEDANRTFLLLVNGTFKKDKSQSNYIFLNFLMGGATTIDELSDFILLPLACSENDEDLAILFMNAYVNIVQQHLKLLQEKPKQARAELDTYNSGIDKLTGRQIVMHRSAIAYDVTDGEIVELFNNNISFVTDLEMEHAVNTQAKNKVAAITLFPDNEQSGGYCYNLLIACDTHELLYFKRHKIRGNNQSGFLKEELKRISIPFRDKKGIPFINL